jgi:DNA-binding NarL/FixJ family response regulator
MLESKPIRVMLVDDHAVVRSGLSAFLMVYPDLELVGEAESGEEAVARAALLQPDVILMDLVMPGIGHRVGQRHPLGARPAHDALFGGGPGAGAFGLPIGARQR